MLSYFSPEAESTSIPFRRCCSVWKQTRKISRRFINCIGLRTRSRGRPIPSGLKWWETFAHPIEACMIAVREGHAAIAPHWITVIRHAVQMMRALMAREAGSVARLQQEVPRIKTLLRELENGTSQASAEMPASPHPQTPPSSEVMPAAWPVADSAAQPISTSHSSGLAEAYLIPNLDAEVMSYFAPEAQEYLESLEADLLRVDKDAADPETIHQLFRTAHTLKGSAYTVGFQAIGDLTHHIEDFMGAVREGQLQLLPGHTDVLLRAIDVIRALMRRDPSILGVRANDSRPHCRS